MTSSFVQLARRLAGFPKKSREQKLSSYAYRWHKWFPHAPVPIRLPWGAWWLLDFDFLGRSLLTNGYEDAEHQFVDRFLKPGMTVLDIGAHRGFHTLFFSRKVGPHGRVLAFEPSAEDRNRLMLHVRINRCRNTQIFGCAVGAQEGRAEMYVVPDNTVLNSLRMRPEAQATKPITVPVRRLDDVLQEVQAKPVDFVKLDVEGGERDALNGAMSFLQCTPRPVILCEVLEELTQLWGYASYAIIASLERLGFRWFGLNAKGQLVPVPPQQREFHGNLVAVPKERLPGITLLLAPEATAMGAIQ